MEGIEAAWEEKKDSLLGSPLVPLLQSKVFRERIFYYSGHSHLAGQVESALGHVGNESGCLNLLQT